MTPVGEDATMTSGHDSPDPHDAHDSHDSHDSHDHGASDDSWVLLPLAVGLVIALVIVVIMGIDSGVPAFT